MYAILVMAVCLPVIDTICQNINKQLALWAQWVWSSSSLTSSEMQSPPFSLTASKAFRRNPFGSWTAPPTPCEVIVRGREREREREEGREREREREKERGEGKAEGETEEREREGRK